MIRHGAPATHPTSGRPRASSPKATPRSQPAPAKDGVAAHTSSRRSQSFDWRIPRAEDGASSARPLEWITDMRFASTSARNRQVKSRDSRNQGLTGARPSRQLGVSGGASAASPCPQVPSRLRKSFRHPLDYSAYGPVPPPFFNRLLTAPNDPQVTRLPAGQITKMLQIAASITGNPRGKSGGRKRGHWCR